MLLSLAWTLVTTLLGSFQGIGIGFGHFKAISSGAPSTQIGSSGLSNCIYQLDTGVADSQMGLINGGDTVWIVQYDTMDYALPSDVIVVVGTAYGAGSVESTPPPGTPARLFVWNDTDNDGDPRTGLELVNESPTTVQNGNRNVVNLTRLSASAPVSGVFFIGVSVSHDPDIHPSAGDQDAGYSTRSWITGNTQQGGFDPTDLQGPGSVGVFNMQEYGIFLTWMLRAIGTNNDVSLYCLGDGTGSACPCGNEASQDIVQGCSNSLGNGGSIGPTGSCSIALDDFRVLGSNLIPNQPALLFAGNSAPNGGNGVFFGDGLRCAGMGVVRLGVKAPGNTLYDFGTATWGPGLGARGGWAAGDVKCIQAWYRDPSGSSPCGTGFNLTSAIRLEVGP